MRGQVCMPKNSRVAKRVFHNPAVVLLVGVMLFLGGCFVIKARPIDATAFLPHGAELIDMPERAPFNGIFVPDSKRFDAVVEMHRKVVILPVDTEYASQRIVDGDLPDAFKQRRLEELEEMGRYFQARVRQTLEDYRRPDVDEEILASGSAGATTDSDTTPYFMLADEVSADSVVLELALVEVQPTNPGINIVGTIGGFLLPGGGIIKLLGTGSVAIEGRIRDGESGEVFFEFKDREIDKASAFSVKDFQMYAHARRTIDEWAGQIAEILSTGSDQQVNDALPFSLNPL